MDIKRLLELRKHCSDERELVGMILSNRITHYMGDKVGAVISISQADSLIDDLIEWKEFTKEKPLPDGPERV